MKNRGLAVVMSCDGCLDGAETEFVRIIHPDSQLAALGEAQKP